MTSYSKNHLSEKAGYLLMGWFPLVLFLTTPVLALAFYFFPDKKFILAGKDFLIITFFFCILFFGSQTGRKSMWLLIFLPFALLAGISFFTSNADISPKAASLRQLIYPIVFLFLGASAGLNREALQKLKELHKGHIWVILLAGFLMYILPSSILDWIKPYFEAKGIDMAHDGLPAQWLEPIGPGIKRFASTFFDPVNFGHWICFAIFFLIPAEKSAKKNSFYTLLAFSILALILSFCKGAWLQSMIVLTGLLLPVPFWLKALGISFIPAGIYVAAGFHAGIANHQTGLENALETLTFWGFGLGSTGNVAIIFNEFVSPHIFDTYAGAIIGQLGLAGILAWVLGWGLVVWLLFRVNKNLAWLTLAQLITSFYSENAFNLMSTFGICTYIGMELNQFLPRNEKVAILDPVGKKAGMDFYSLKLSEAASVSGLVCLLFSNFSIKGSSHVFQTFHADKTNTLGKFLDYFGGHFKSFSICRKEGVSAILFHSFKTGLKEFFVLLISKIFGFRNFLLIHDVESFDGTDARILKFLTIRLLADEIFCQNQTSRKLVSQNFGIPVDAIRMIPHGHFFELSSGNISKLEARKKLGLPSDSFLFLFFGQIKPVKGLDILLKAIELVPNAHLVIAGKERGEDFSRYEADIIGKGLKSRVHCFIRYIENEERDLFFRACDSLVIPYRKIYQSGVLIMGMSYRIPCIASDLPPNKELIRNNVNGYLFQNENPSELANTMIQVMESSTNSITQNAAEDLLKHHNWDSGGESMSRAVLNT